MDEIREMEDTKTIPTVAIIGRPNVGKSTLFNRLLGKRRAITSPVAGVTRDTISERWLLGNHPVTLVDSGGVKVDQEEMDSLVAKRSLGLLDKADAILFMVDCTGMTAEDDELMQTLRPYTDKVVLVVNKVDDEKRNDLVWDFYGYGYQRVVGISSAHGRGIEDLEDTLMGILNLTTVENAPESAPQLRLAILGKPNTGKSTLTNLLVGSDLSLVSDIAGTTRDVVRGTFTYKGTEFSVMDTAGIRRKGKVEDDVEYYSVNRAIKSIDEADVVMLMIDSLEGVTDQDKKIAGLVTRRGVGIVLVLNKIDLLTVKNQLQAIEDRTRFLFPVLGFAPLVAISAKNGENIGKLLDTVWEVHCEMQKRVDTSVLNAAVARWGEKYQPPRGELGHYKVYYGTQISAAPVKFLFFVNHTKDFPPAYLQYLKNCIRKDLGFTMVPVEIDLRERRRNPSLHDKPKQVVSLTAIKKHAAEKAVKARSGGRAKAKARPVKPGNKASYGKALKRQSKIQKNAGQMQQHLQKKHGR